MELVLYGAAKVTPGKDKGAKKKKGKKEVQPRCTSREREGERYGRIDGMVTTLAVSKPG